jgi:tetratricopeptide (TPR) repeat protein
MARATVFRFKGAPDPQETGRKLGVGAVLTGTVSRRGDQLSISAELVEISTGVRLWGQKYDRPVADLLRVQDSIASDISDALRLRLSGQEKRTLGRHGTQNPEAYELYLKARFLLSRDTDEGDLEARRLFLQALEKDPMFVEAHLGIASVYNRSASRGHTPQAEAWARADEEIQKALDLDPANVLARAALANRRFRLDWDWARAEKEFRELSGDARLLLGLQYQPIALFFWARGRPDEAVALMERALRVDPENLESRIMLADLLAQAGRLEEAIGHYRAIMEDEPSNASPLFGLADVLRRRGDLTGATFALRKAYELSGEDHGVKALAAARTEEDYENAEVAVARVRLGELEALAKERYVSPLDLGRLYAQAGEREKAFASLEAAVAERSPGLLFLKVDRAWDRIRDDARFAALVRRVGIP